MSFSEAINAVTGSSPAQLPLVIGCQKTGVLSKADAAMIKTVLKEHIFYTRLVFAEGEQCGFYSVDNNFNLY